jgi:hypothetical protein
MQMHVALITGLTKRLNRIETLNKFIATLHFYTCQFVVNVDLRGLLFPCTFPYIRVFELFA